jgi:hypothetical protein
MTQMVSLGMRFWRGMFMGKLYCPTYLGSPDTLSSILLNHIVRI